MSEHDHSDEPRLGRCLCGEVCYAVAGQPLHVTICYCRFCQRATGSTHLFEPIWDAGAFSILAGEPRMFAARSEGSGKQIFVYFCGTCGTKLYQRFERFADVVGLYGGTLDEPAAATAGADVSCIFVDEAPKGSIIPAGMRAWKKHRTTNDGDPIEPMLFDEPRTI